MSELLNSGLSDNITLSLVLGLAAIIIGSMLGGAYEKLIRSTSMQVSLRAPLAFYGKALITLGGWIIALVLIPWSSLQIDERLAVFFSLVFGLIAARLDNLLAALTGAASMARVGETIEVDGEVVKIKEKGLFRIKGTTLGGKYIFIGYAQLAASTFINWTRCPYARSYIEIHVDDPDHNIDAVYEAIDSVIKPNGQYDPSYSILEPDEEAKKHGAIPRHAFRGYTGQEPNSHGYKIYFFNRFVGERGSTTLKLQETIFRACTERGISLGQTGNLSASNFKVQIDK